MSEARRLTRDLGKNADGEGEALRWDRASVLPLEIRLRGVDEHVELPEFPGAPNLSGGGWRGRVAKLRGAQLELVELPLEWFAVALDVSDLEPCLDDGSVGRRSPLLQRVTANEAGAVCGGSSLASVRKQ